MTERFLILPFFLIASAAFAQTSDVSAVILADPTGDADHSFAWSIDVINSRSTTSEFSRAVKVE
ncbi:MAG TPA: hypothetical protein VHU41_17270 [Thermoanaerobaculia bacterium]|jgi:hypothetical protein|nr:hypothetical protein [Thermoanaerobaculia bacterium]